MRPTGVSIALLHLVLWVSAEGSQASRLPVVDLGYELHQALEHNTSYDVYKFSNIRYAQPPTGDLRFRAPRPPQTNRSSVVKGDEIRVCPQGVPAWQAKSTTLIRKYTAGAPFTLESWEADFRNATVPPGDPNQGGVEDCLFLDVYVPGRVFNRSSGISNSGAGSASGKGASVLAWIHGGGYVLGAKSGRAPPLWNQYNPLDLLKYGQQQSDQGLIFVAINYRLGALGWIASPHANDSVRNAGLLDQRLALDWIQEYIHLFGGDPDRVTVMGESAGGGSIMAHLTAYGGKKGPAPFAQAIAQSPAFYLVPGSLEQGYTGFLSQLNVSTLSEARKLPSDTVMAANAANVANAPPNSYLYQPIPDGSYIPSLPSQLLRQGAYDTSVRVLTGLNSFEGAFFFDVAVATEDDFESWLGNTIARLSPAAVRHTAAVIYPPVFDGFLGYTDQATRQMALVGDALFAVNADLINTHYRNHSWSYEFSLPPGLHTQDLGYTFTGPTLFPAVQRAYQKFLVSFVVSGSPSLYSSDNTTSPFPRWDSNTKRVVNITTAGLVLGTRVYNETRLEWWREGAVGYR